MCKANVVYKKYCMYRKDTEQYNNWKSFFNVTNSSDIEKEIIKQINALKLFDMESHNAILK